LGSCLLVCCTPAWQPDECCCYSSGTQQLLSCLTGSPHKLTWIRGCKLSMAATGLHNTMPVQPCVAFHNVTSMHTWSPGYLDVTNTALFHYSMQCQDITVPGSGPCADLRRVTFCCAFLLACLPACLPAPLPAWPACPP
jgi:hypothetical protein